MNITCSPAVVVSAVGGAILGVLISWIVNCTLIEISLNAFFSIYFGVLFVAVGLFMLWRIKVQEPHEIQQRKLEYNLSIVVVVAGCLCFVLKKNWCVGLTPLMKIPLYSILGTSISFALTFSFVDLVNYASGFFQSHMTKNLVESRQQIYVILGSTLMMGAIFGTIFGYMDIEDASAYQIRLSLLKEEQYCYPIGAILGGVAGVANEHIRQQRSLPYFSIGQHIDEFDDDI